jgi:hypothetical protein
LGTVSEPLPVDEFIMLKVVADDDDFDEFFDNDQIEPIAEHSYFASDRQQERPNDTYFDHIRQQEQLARRYISTIFKEKVFDMVESNYQMFKEAIEEVMSSMFADYDGYIKKKVDVHVRRVVEERIQSSKRVEKRLMGVINKAVGEVTEGLIEDAIQEAVCKQAKRILDEKEVVPQIQGRVFELMVKQLNAWGLQERVTGVVMREVKLAMKEVI